MAPHPWRPPKRQRRTTDTPSTEKKEYEPPKYAYIQAYEANLAYDHPAPAPSLFTSNGYAPTTMQERAGGASGTGIGSGNGTGTGTGARVGGGLIKWAGSWEDDEDGEGGEVWADR